MPEHARLPMWFNQPDHDRIETLRRLVDDLYGYVLSEARQRLIGLLAAHLPADAKEAADLALIQVMLVRYPNLVSKSCEVGHITGSALVLDVTSGRFLLHRHKTLNRWLQLGGHGEFDVDPADIALREAVEESGLTDVRFFPATTDPHPLDIDAHTIPATEARPEHLHLDFRYLLATGQPDAVRAGAGESGEFRWMTSSDLDTLPGQIDPALLRFIGKAAALYGAFSGASEPPRSD